MSAHIGLGKSRLVIAALITAICGTGVSAAGIYGATGTHAAVTIQAGASGYATTDTGTAPAANTPWG